jgi:TldD protein
MEKRSPYAYSLYTYEELLTIQVDKSGVSLSTNGPKEGVVLGVYDGIALREEATSLISQEVLGKISRRLGPSGLGPRSVSMIDAGAPLEKTWVESGTRDSSSVPLSTLVDQARSLAERVQAKSSRTAETRVELTTGTTERLFVNRNRRLHQSLGRGGVSIQVIMPSDRGVPGIYGLRKRGVGGLELLDVQDPEIDEIVERAERLIGAEAPASGGKVLVTEPDVAGVLAHESFGHGVETDMFVKGRARAAEFVGKTVGSSLVQILDDPTQKGSSGFYYFDDEGAFAVPTTIVENGVFRSGLTDWLSATQLKIKRTANGRREAFDHKSYARMSNTFFAAGATPVEQLIGEVQDGLLVGGFRGGIEDPKGWGIQVVAQYGEEIKKGKLTGRAFSPVTLSGYVPDVLASVDGVGADFRLASGTCGKGSKEWVPVGMGGPHLRLRARVS